MRTRIATGQDHGQGRHRWRLVGDSTLSHVRLDRTGSDDYRLTPEGDQEVPGRPSGGAANEIEEVPLSEVIAELNERFGLDMGTSDQILVVQQIQSMVDDPKLQAAALVNDLDRFGQVADPRLDEIVAENHDNNTSFVRKYFDDSQFQSAVKDYSRRLGPHRTRCHPTPREDSVAAPRSHSSGCLGIRPAPGR